MTNPTTRIKLIDSLRGFALLGIFLVNIMFFTTSLQTISYRAELWTEGYNEILMWLRRIVVEGKFIMIFSFLFGFGMVLLRNKSLATGRKFNRIYTRRLTALLVIGLIHGTLIWYGDILTHYAILGFILMLFGRCKPRTLLIWSVALLLIVPVFTVGTSLLNSTSSPAYEQVNQSVVNQIGKYYQELDASIYGEGTAAQIIIQRVNDFISSAVNTAFFYPQILGMFLMGAYFCKRRILHDVQKNKKGIAKLIVIGGGVGLAFQLVMLLVDELQLWGELLAIFIGAPLLALTYISIFALLYQRESWRRILDWFSYPGKMAFTNYLLQSFLCGMIFYSYGLGWYGRVEPIWQMLIVFVIFALQVAFSKFWLMKYSIGPLEYVWRLFTYWKKPVKQKDNLNAHF